MILLFKSMVRVAGHMRDGVFIAPHVRRADEFAARSHEGQYRKGKPGAAKVPYIEHPRAVATILHREAGVTDPVVLSAALLHDTMEDCGVSHENLVAEFGHEVADIVSELTNAVDYGPCGKAAWQATHAATMSPKASMVKVADKTANLRDLVNSPPDWPTERKRKYFEDARQVVQSMGAKHPVMSQLFETTFLSGIEKL